MSDLEKDLLDTLIHAAARLALVAKMVDTLPTAMPGQTPIRDLIPAHWPTLSDFRVLRAAVEAIMNNPVVAPILDDKTKRVKILVSMDRPSDATVSELVEYVESVLIGHLPMARGEIELSELRVRATLSRDKRKIKSPISTRRIR